MPEFILGNTTVTLRPKDIVGSGGEADIYRTGKEAYKVFKQQGHIDLAGSPSLQREAREKLKEHQQKLPALMRLRLPDKVPTPTELLRDKQGLIAGFRMNFIDDVEVMLRYGERSFRSQGVTDDTVRDVFVDLHKTVGEAHRRGFVFGDFNDLNVLVKDKEAYVIDADSGQFGNFMTRMFTAKFVDPLICDPKASAPLMMRPHSPDTDWYAYAVMLMQSLLFVGPYGGVYRPADQKKAVPHDARPLRRITVFDNEVRYPKPARPYKILPDTLLAYFDEVFKKDKRGEPPLSLLESLRFTACSKCGVTHARTVCPECVGVTPIMVKEKHVGAVKGTKLFETSGPILFAAMQEGTLRYLYWDAGEYRREGGKTVVAAPLDPNIRFRIRGDDSILSRGTQCLVFSSGTSSPATLMSDAYMGGLLPLVDANATHLFLVEGGGLYRIADLGVEYRERVGDVLPNQTLFWTGEELGFGFYRAAELSNFFVFRPRYRGLNDSVKLPAIRSQLVDSTCCFGHDRIWFFTATQEGGKAVNRCFLLNGKGELLADAVATPGDGSWLSRIRGAAAAGDFLLVPTDEGVVRVRQNGAALDVDKEYPDTGRFVDAASNLFLSKEGLMVVRAHDIWRLVLG
jgi:H/ACA ribonucleoprotein complex subunit 3